MKKRITLFLLTSAFSTSLLFAQGPANPPTPADIAQRQVNRLTELLGLSSQLQAEALTIFTTAATTASNLFPQMKTARTQLQTDAESNNTSALSQDATDIANLEAQITLANAQAEAAFWNILTPDQRAKLSQFRSQGPGRFGGGPGPGPGGFRRGPK